MLRKKIICFLFVLTCGFIQAQELHYLFQRLGVKEGLFEETVHAVQQDAKGFIWLNFRTLIQRYDGQRLINFFPGTQLPEGNIRGMTIDKKNRMWLLSGDATLGWLDPDNLKYHQIKVNIPKGYSHTVSAFYINRSDEVILIWFQQGFITYNDASGVADLTNNPFTLPRSCKPNHFFQDERLNYWIGTANGLVKYNSTKKLLSWHGNNAEKDPNITAYENLRSVNSVYIDKSNLCWIITWELGLKVISFNPSNQKKTDWTDKLSRLTDRYYVPYGFFENTKGDIWLAGEDLFCKVDPVKETIHSISQKSSFEYGIFYDVIFASYEDKEKNIWLGTNRGLYRFNPEGQYFSTLLTPRPGSDQSVEIEPTDFLETENGEIIASTWGRGYFAYNQDFQPIKSTNITEEKMMETVMAWSMIQRPNGDIWCGMQNGIVSIFETKKKSFRQEFPTVAEGKTIRQLAQDKNGNIWLGTHTGAVIRWDAAIGTYQKILQVDGIISRLYVDLQNRIWVGTDKLGLYYLNCSTGQVIEHYTSKGAKGKTLLINGVSDILQYNDSIFYIGGNGLSILNTNTNQFQYFTVSQGLPSANISNIIKDNNGYIWMTTGAGIVSYHPSKRKLSHYDARDGVPNYNFNAGAAFVMKNGNIVVGTNKEILQFNPNELSKRIYLPPRVYIAAIEIMSESKNVDSLLKLPVIELGPDHNSFAVATSTLSYKDNYPVYHQLDGIDKNWKRTDKSGEIEYNYLPPGKYLLKTACLKEDGSPGEITSIPFYIEAPFYRTWWFYTFITLLVGALLFWIDRERIKRREDLYKMRTDIANNLHKDVNTALQNINILSEMARVKADKDVNKSKEFIEQIHSKSHNMMLAMDDMLWSIDPVNDSMEKTILRMQEFLEALSNRHDVRISMLVDEKVKKLNLNMQLRHDAFILFRESIRNIVAAGVMDCKVHIESEKNNIILTVECNNQFSDLQQLNNLLQSTELAQKIDSINATLHTKVHKSNTVLMLRVPV